MLALLVGHWHLRGYGQWTVIEKTTGLIVGRVGLWNPEGWPGLELGWVIRRSHWDRGYATEASREAIAFAFDNVGADHVISLIQPDNVRSIRVAEKIGERFERILTHDGRDTQIYGIRRVGYVSQSVSQPIPAPTAADVHSTKTLPDVGSSGSLKAAPTAP